MKWKYWFTVLFFGCLSLYAISTNRAYATSIITVTTTQDELNSDGDCSLREAVMTMNRQIQTDQCRVGQSIELPSGIYTLKINGMQEDGGEKGDLDIWSDVVIEGIGRVTIDGFEQDRIFDVLDRGSLTVKNVLLTGGKETQGAVVQNKGTLNMESVSVARNTGSNVYSNLLYNSDQASLTQTSWLQNSVGSVVILNDGGDLLIEGSAIVDNEMAGLANNGNSTLYNTTISQNNTLSGAVMNTGELDLFSTTIAFNQGARRSMVGGLHNSRTGIVTVQNTLLGENQPTNCKNDGAVTSRGYNLSDDATCPFSHLKDQNNAMADLLPLQGIPAAHPLGENSQAIDMGGAFRYCPATDQQLRPRPIDGDDDGLSRCDIGAYEIDTIPKPNLTVSQFNYAQLVATHGDLITPDVNLTVHNAGSADASGGYTIGLYLSSDDTITTADILLTEIAGPALASGASVVVSFPDAALPSNFKGENYIGVILDSNNIVAEGNEADNTSQDDWFLLPTGAYTWHVNSTADDLSYVSFRFALTYARSGDDIGFATAVFPATITLNSPLPTIQQDNLTIDASNAGVTLDGSALTGSHNGLTIKADSTLLLGLTIQNMPEYAISIEGETNTIGGYLFVDCSNGISVGGPPAQPYNIFQGNQAGGVLIQGDDNVVAGNLIRENGRYGILIPHGRNNIIGGEYEQSGNVIGRHDVGIALIGNQTQNNYVSANYIGTGYNGNNADPNQTGIFIEDSATANIIGGAKSCLGNLIGGNEQWGIHIENTWGNQIEGNRIGSGQNREPLGNRDGGIYIQDAAGVQVGSDRMSDDICDGGCNLISGNQGDGIRISGANASSNQIIGNFIGIDAQGMSMVRNEGHGIHLNNDTSKNDIGQNGRKGNVISANQGAGIYLTNSQDNVIHNNLIGVDSQQQNTLGNQVGVWLNNASYIDVIANTISGNNTYGIHIAGNNSQQIIIRNNHIGTNNDATRYLGNSLSGIFLAEESHSNSVLQNTVMGNFENGIEASNSHHNHIESNDLGATASTPTVIMANGDNGILLRDGSTDNLILFNFIRGNGLSGVQIVGEPTIGNTLQMNTIHHHPRLRIDNVDLGNQEIDPPRLDTVVENATIAGSWDISVRTCASCKVDLYAYAGHGSEIMRLGQQTADSNGNAQYTHVSVPAGMYLDLTTTDTNGNTSEFLSDERGSEDVTVTAVEVNQALQTPRNEVPLIAGKDTIVRVHVQSTYMPVSTTATLQLFRNGSYLTTLTPNLANDCPKYLPVQPRPQRVQLNHAFCFQLAESHIVDGNLQLLATIDPQNELKEIDENNNTYQVHVNFDTSAPLGLKLYTVNYPETLKRTHTIADAYPNNSNFTLGDIDGDGLDEIIIGQRESQDIFIHEYKDEKIQQTHILNDLYSLYDDLTTGDLNGNGHDELILAYDHSNQIVIWEYYTTTSGLVWEEKLVYDFPFDAHDNITAGDIDQDGKDELLIGYRDEGELTILELVGYDLTFPFSSFSYAQLGIGRMDDLTIADINMDGLAEILLGDADTGYIRFYNFTSGGLLIDPPAPLPKTSWFEFTDSDSLAAGDLDVNLVGGQGFAEILVSGDLCECVDIFVWNGAKWELTARYDSWDDREPSVYTADGSLQVGRVYNTNNRADVVTGSSTNNRVQIHEKPKDGAWTTISPTQTYVDETISLLERMYPIPHVQLSGGTTHNMTFEILDGTPRNGRVYDRLRAERNNDGDRTSSYIGLLEAVTGSGGQALYDPKVAVVALSTNSSGDINGLMNGPHEIGHTRQLRHTHFPRCGPGGDQFPVPNGYIGYPGYADDLHVLNVSNPTNPQWQGGAGEHLTHNGFSRDVYTEGNRVYVAVYGEGSVTGGLLIYDRNHLATMEIPYPIASYPLEQGARRIQVRNNIVYVADVYGGVIVLDTQDEHNIQELDRFLPPEVEQTGFYPHVYDIQLIGDHLYVIDYPYVKWGGVRAGGDLHVFDVSDPTTLNLLGNIQPHYWPNGVTVEGNYAYIAGNDGMGIYDIQDPENIVEVGLWDDVNDVDFFDIAIIGNTAYMVGHDKMVVLDIADKSNPQKIAETWEIKKGLEIATAGGFAYIAGQTNGVYITDITNSVTPTIVSTYQLPNTTISVDGLHLVNNQLYIASWDSSVYGLDVGDANLGIGLTVHDPFFKTDLMSYCSNQWISTHNYLALQEEMNDPYVVANFWNHNDAVFAPPNQDTPKISTQSQGTFASQANEEVITATAQHKAPPTSSPAHTYDWFSRMIFLLVGLSVFSGWHILNR